MVDPIGAILAVLVFKVAMAPNLEEARTETLQSLGIMIVVGVVAALVIAKLVELLLKHHKVPDYLQPVFLLAVVAVAFTVSNFFEKEASLLTVTVLGIALANQRSVSVQHILEFKENLRTLIISSLFLILSGRIAPSDLGETFWKGAMLLVFLIVVGRPVSVFLSLLYSKRTTLKERAFLAAMAPRGIVAAAITSIFALEFEEAAEHGRFGDLSETIATQSHELVALVFLVIIGTVSLYGIAAVPLTRRLGLASRDATGVLFAGASDWVRKVAKCLHENGHRVMLLDTNDRNILAAKMMALDVQRASVLSEFAEEELDFNGIGHLVAATTNDEVNSMAAHRFAHQFSRAGCWQLKPVDSSAHHRKAAADELRSNLCFRGAPSHAELAKAAADGAVMKKTAITEVYGFDQFEENDPHAIVLFLSDSKGLRPAPENLTKVSAGTSVYALIPREDDPDE